METHSPNPPKPLGTPEWMFPWRRSESAFFSTLFAAIIGGCLFALAFASVTVKLSVPKPQVPRKASLIYLTNSNEGRALALKAQEAGPFPSRFRPTQWEGMAALEATLMATTRLPHEIYTTKLQALPKTPLTHKAPLLLEPEMVFPKSVATEKAPESAQRMKLTPQLFPLSGIKAQDLPNALPEYLGGVEGGIASASWRFLLELDATGKVGECISLEKGGDPGALDLQKWLQSIRFPTASSPHARWISVGIGFTNQADNGPDN